MLHRIVNNRKTQLIFVFVAICVLTIIFFILSKLNFQQGNNSASNLEKQTISTDRIVIDFETRQYLDPATMHVISSDISYSGSKSSVMPDKDSYSAAIILEPDNLNAENISEIGLYCWLYSEKKEINIMLVLSVFDALGQQIYWQGHHIKSNNIQAEQWFYTGDVFNINDSLLVSGNKIKIYAFNSLGPNHKVYIDDVELIVNHSEITKSHARSALIDFENMQADGITTKQAYQGLQSAITTGENAYSFVSSFSLSDFDLSNIDQMNYRFFFLNQKEEVNFVLVFSIKDSDGNVVHWYGHHVNQQTKPGEWNRMQGYMPLDAEVCHPDNILEVYGWNRNQNTVFVDDIYFVLKSKGDIKQGSEVLCDLTVNPDFSPKINQPPYPVLFFETGRVTPLGLSPSASRYNIAITVNILGTPYQQVIAGVSSDKLSCYYVEDKRLRSKPLKLDAVLSDKIVLVNYNSNGNKSDEILVFDNSNNMIYCLRLEVERDVINSVKIWEQSYESAGLNYSVKKVCTIIENNKPNGLLIYDSFDLFYTVPVNNQLQAIQTIPSEKGEIIFWQCGNLLADNPGNELLCIYASSKASYYRIFGIETKQGSVSLKAIGNKISGNTGYDGMPATANYFIGNFSDNQYLNTLMLDRSWRFDMKMLKLSRQFYEITHYIDFKGFADGNNPKYYPATVLVSGNFYGDLHDELMCFSFTCKQSQKQKMPRNSKQQMLNQKAEVYEIE